MLQQVFDFVTGNALLLMLIGIPVAFVMNTAMWVFYRIQNKEVKVSPVGQAATFVVWILAMEGLITIGVSAAQGQTWNNVVQTLWNNFLDWLGGGRSTGSTARFVVLGLLVRPRPFPQWQRLFRSGRR